jgi:hypothetical protein
VDSLSRALDTQRAAFTVAAQQAVFAAMAFNPNQRRGPNGRWTKMGGVSAAPTDLTWGRQGARISPREGGGAGLTLRSPWKAGSELELSRDDIAAIGGFHRAAREALAANRRAEPEIVVGPLGLASSSSGHLVNGGGVGVSLDDVQMAELVDGLRAVAGFGPDEGWDVVPDASPAAPEPPGGPATGRDAYATVSNLGDAAAAYVGEGYRDINNYLRGVGDRQYDGMGADIARLTRAISNRPLSRPIEVWRGARSGQRTFGSAYTRESMEGLEWVEDGFVSTTADQQVLARYGEFGTPNTDGDAWADSIRMRVAVPAGTGAGRVGSWDYEAEVLLNRGTRYRVTKDHGLVDGFRKFDVEVIGDGSGS